MADTTKEYLIKSKVRIGSEIITPVAGEALVMPLEPKVGDSLVEQGAAELFVKAAPKAKKDEK